MKLLIDWHENQAIDKGMILGMKVFFPNIITKGYQGYIISDKYNFYINPTDLEINNNLLPDEINVIGKKLKSKVTKYSKNIKVNVAPALDS